MAIDDTPFTGASGTVERADFFVSYADVDSGWAEWVAWQLEDVGYRILVQAWDFVPGTNWAAGMQGGVTQARRTIALLSSAYLRSVYGQAEWQAAQAIDPLGFARKLVPIRLEDCPRPGLLNTIISFDLFGYPAEAARLHLLNMIKNVLDGRAKPATAPTFPTPLSPDSSERPEPSSTVRRPPSTAPQFPGSLLPRKAPHNSLSNPQCHLQASPPAGTPEEPESLAQPDDPHAKRIISETTSHGTRIQQERQYHTSTGGTLPRPEDVDVAWLNTLPRPPTPVFVGRDDALHILGHNLRLHDNSVITQALAGLGGVGKTELALNYAHKNRRQYALIAWITADNLEHLQAGLGALAIRIAPELAGSPTAVAVEWAMAWLQTHSQWLLVLDNVEDPLDIQQLLGQLNCGHILITSRRTDWGGLATPIRLEVLSMESAINLIQTVTRRKDREEELARLATELGCLPLAVSQAAAYLRRHPTVNIDGYLTLLRDQPTRLHLVGRIWQVSLDIISQAYPEAVKILNILAWYAPDDIPLDLISRGNDYVETCEALAALDSYSLIDFIPPLVSIHRLIQATIIADQRGRESYTKYRSMALNRLAESLPDDPQDDVGGWPLWRLLVPHTSAIAAHFAPGREPELLGRVLNQTGIFLRAEGRHHFAHANAARALTIAETVLGASHTAIAPRLSNLAGICWAMGRANEALSMFERALEITKVTLGPSHPDVALRLGNVAGSLWLSGRPGDALPLQAQALAMVESGSEFSGLEHPDVAIWSGDLAASLWALGRPEEALPLFQRALDVTRIRLGNSHPHVAIRLGNLAVNLWALGRPSDALPLQEDALRIVETALGPDHPDVAIRLGNLGIGLLMLDRPQESLTLFKRALAIVEPTLGPKHPDTATWLGYLALAYADSGRMADAVSALRNAYPSVRDCLGHRSSLTKQIIQYSQILGVNLFSTTKSSSATADNGISR